MMKPAPAGWPRLSSAVFYDDAPAAIDWLCAAFGFEVRLRVDGEGGTIVHSELVFGDAVVMVGDTRADAKPGPAMVSPRSVGGQVTQGIMIYVDDADAHCARARAAGATIAYGPTVSDYGEDYWSDNSYLAVDPEGHGWWFCQRVRG